MWAGSISTALFAVTASSWLRPAGRGPILLGSIRTRPGIPAAVLALPATSLVLASLSLILPLAPPLALTAFSTT
ncbi:MAG: hypothetical protein V3U39_10640, partial [Acidimicrobiia bacterium]